PNPLPGLTLPATANTFMKILALELSTAVGGVAFRAAGGSTFVRQFPADRKDSGLFYENLRAVRDEYGLPETIAIGLGPGSYAGVRIAIATALGLRAASAARLLGLPSICAFDCARYCVIGDARRHSYFFARINDGNCIEGPTLMTNEELARTLDEPREGPLFSSQLLAEFPEAVLAYPSAAILAALAETRVPDNNPLEPIYLRQPYITTAKTTPWTR
ncbi:MAG: tRNA (adenosine(37)-N6)-threonylcarbamoyltransferase complex dimerization subunit type 1 TsaB, partial [Chthoniobacterales bacterium]